MKMETVSNTDRENASWRHLRTTLAACFCLSVKAATVKTDARAAIN